MKTVSNRLKKNLIVSFVFLCSFEVYPQSFESTITIDYDMYILFNNFPYFVSKLEYNSTKSLFTYQQHGENPTSKKTSKVLKGGDNGKSVIKVDTTTKKIYADRNSGLLLPYDKTTMTIDSMNIITWKLIQDSTKNIAGYKCYMATGYFRGCVYTVWYTPDIPSSFGPWKLNGTPGLILEATRDDKVLSFYATNISFEKHFVTVDTANKTVKTYAEEKQKLVDDINKLNEEFVANQPRGSNFILPFYVPCLECDFLYELKRFSTISFRKKVSFDSNDKGEEIK